MNDYAMRHTYRGKVFKGEKRGEWVYGSYLRTNTISGTLHEIFVPSARSPYNYVRYQVIGETVGQCTGKKSKGGAILFEGDLVECRTTYGVGRGVIVWCGDGLKVFWDSKLTHPNHSPTQSYYNINSYTDLLGNVFDIGEKSDRKE